MRTITFYSYKGGVGRSLLVANAAKYLSTLGKNVFAVDLDLEAPGLHYKFALDDPSQSKKEAIGVIDALTYFLNQHRFPPLLIDYTTEIAVPESAGRIQLMSAGSAPHRDYWKKLAQVNWHDLFYGSNPIGVPFFLELKERIRKEFQPDFILIDARTGITEMGGVATTLLPDTIVCLALGSVEHLAGLRAVIRGIRQSAMLNEAQTVVEIVPIISRLPLRNDQSLETHALSEIRDFLNAPLDDGSSDPKINDIAVLHSEPFLDTGEQLLVGGKKGPHELPLLRDYLRLFSRIIPAEEIRPHVGKLIQQATSRLLDDPDTAQSELEALTTYCGDEEAYRALLKLYRVRKAPIDKRISAAAVMWQLGVSPSDPLLQETVKLTSEMRATDVQRNYSDFIAAAWRASDMKDEKTAMSLVSAYMPEQRHKAIDLLKEYISKVDPPNTVLLVRLIDLLRGVTPARALELIERFKGSISDSVFQAAWARVIVDQKDVELAQSALEDTAFRKEGVRAEDPMTLYRLLRLVGSEEAAGLLKVAVEEATTTRSLSRLRELGEIFLEEGKLEDFVTRVRPLLPKQMIDEILDFLQHRSRRHRIFSGRFIGAE